MRQSNPRKLRLASIALVSCASMAVCRCDDTPAHLDAPPASTEEDGNLCLGVACDGLDTACAKGRCDPASGRCVAALEPPGTPCDDADACTVGDACGDIGQCLPGDPLECDDGIFCNGSEICDALFGCGTAAAPACDDSGSCLLSNCDESTRSCVRRPDHTRCPDGYVCNSEGSCEVGRACGADADCQDDSQCNGAERCLSDLCVPGDPMDCSDAWACTSDACWEYTGCVHEPRDADCADGSQCNGAERCDPAEPSADARGCVAGAPVSCGDPGCARCDEASGACVFDGAGADEDDDTYVNVGCGGNDCDDADASIHPGGAESCDYVDQDCDGAADEGFGYALLSAPSEMSEPTIASYGDPSVAVVPDGGYGVGFAYRYNDNQSAAALTGEANFSASGARSVDGARWVSKLPRNTRIAASPHGFGLVWTDDLDHDAVHTNGRAYFVALDRLGAPLQPDGVADLGNADEGWDRPGIASDGETYLAVRSSGPDIVATRIDARSGAALGESLIDRGEQAGSVTVRWSDGQYGALYEMAVGGEGSLRFARIATSGAVVGTPIRVAPQGQHPDLAWGGDRWLAVWLDESGVRGRFVDRNANTPNFPIALVPGENWSHVAVAFNGTDFVLATRDFNAIRMERITREGVLFPPAFVASPAQELFFYMGPLEIAWDPSGGVLVYEYMSQSTVQLNSLVSGLVRFGCAP